MWNSYLIIFKHFQSKFEVPVVLGKLILPFSATVLTDFKSHYQNILKTSLITEKLFFLFNCQCHCSITKVTPCEM